MSRRSSIERAQQSWGEPLPDWIEALARACDERTQRETAIRVGYSQAVVNQVLGRSYPGDYASVEAAVRGALMGMVVDCPIYGPIARDACQRNQRLPKGPTGDPARRALRAACPVCPHRIGGDT